MPALRASVIIPTYNRREPLSRLLEALSRQTAPRESFEVIVVDDGSAEEVAPHVAPFAEALQVSVIRQPNSGVAVARQRGVEAARAPIVVFIDDDMLVPEDFVAQHLAAHEGHPDRVVLGRILPAREIDTMPLVERFHAEMLERMSRRSAENGTFSGHELYTGNLSLPKSLFCRVGGFDPSYFIEDTELGVRLDLEGAELRFCPSATSVHAPEATSLDRWLARAVVEGRDWARLGEKHPAVADASPWALLAQVRPAALPLLSAALALPKAAPPLSRALFRAAELADHLGLSGAARAAMMLIYGVRYCEGVRLQTGTLRGLFASYRRYQRTARSG